MIKIAICDDEIVFCKHLEKLLTEYSNSHSLNLEIKIFTGSTHFLDSHSTDTDIVFLDIQMPHQDGLSAAKELRKKDTKHCFNFPLVIVPLSGL